MFQILSFLDIFFHDGFAFQDGVKETGVSLVFTVRAVDAGPVIAFERLEIDDCIKVSTVFFQ